MGPVIRTMVQKTTPTSALAAARASAFELALHQVCDRRQKIDEEAQPGHPCGGHVVVKDALHVAHGLLRGSDHQRLVGAEAEQGEREDNKNMLSDFIPRLTHFRKAAGKLR